MAGGRSHTAFIALGSNLGDRAHNIHGAIDALRQLGEVKATSFLYQSAPMYFTDQAPFLNAAVELHVDTQRCASSHHLLRELKKIEAQCGREKTFANGPRVIDLDLLFFNDEVATIPVEDLPLAVPHPRIAERDFVLKPLADIAPHFMHPTAQQTIKELWQQLQQQQQRQQQSATAVCDNDNNSDTALVPLRRVIPCMNRVLKRTKYLTLGERPLIMGILNVTPDSFSDGGAYVARPSSSSSTPSSSSSSSSSASIAPALDHFARLVADGADIVDIGGESTRPNAAFVTEDEEIRRIIPVIRAIRADRRWDDVVLSVDTRKARVAEAALRAGVDIVNDVSAGHFDAAMLPLVIEWQVPYVAMHMRGDPTTMTQAHHLQYVQAGSGDAAHGISDVVAKELAVSLDQLDRGLPRWLQIIDPGIGFAKDARINVALLQPEVLRRWKEQLCDRALLVGLSRKRFLTHLHQSAAAAAAATSSSSSQLPPLPTTTDTIEDRDRWTAGANCVALLGGADILRVHDVATTKQTCSPFVQLLQT
eukprot:gene17095-12234_t